MKTLLKNKTATLATLFSLLAASPAAALTYGTNITIYDGESKNELFYGMPEDNEVEPGNIKSQSWDLEGFFLDGTKLSMIGGYNFKLGNDGYTSGDIFISTDSNYGTPIGYYGTTRSYDTVKQTFGYEYVLDINWTTLAYNVYKLTTNSYTRTAYYSENETGTATSNPWQYVSGGIWVGSGTGTGGNLLASSVYYGEYGLQGYNYDNRHYGVSFDLGAIFADADLSGQDFYSHFTMGCGNDNLIGHGSTPVPEPSTLLLLTAGLAGLGLYGHKNNRCKKS